MALPDDYVDLQAAQASLPKTRVNIIGVVVDWMSPKEIQNQRGDVQWTMTFKLIDNHLRHPEMSVRFFRDKIENFPKIQNLGDVVVLQKIGMSNYRGSTTALSNWSTEWTVFPNKYIPALGFEIAYEANDSLFCFGKLAEKDKSVVEQKQRNTLQKYVVRLNNDTKEVTTRLAQHRGTDDEAHPLHNRVLESNGGSRNLTSLPLNIPTEPAAMRKDNEATKRVGGNLPDPNITKRSRPNEKFRLIKELKHYDFADLCVEVVKAYPDKDELYVTDYTENRGMYYYSPPEDDKGHGRDGDAFNYTDGVPKKTFPGPYGQQVLLLILKEPHASYARHDVSEGDLLHLRNVNVKHKTERGGNLEGEMWPDRFHVDQVDIHKVKNKDNRIVEDLLVRKEAYWTKRRQQLPDTGEGQQPKQKMSRTEMKRQRKEQKSLAKAGKAQAKSTKKQAGQTSLKVASVKSNTNQHIRCSNDHVPITSVHDVRDPTNAMHSTTTPEGIDYVVPFINARYRVKVGVVDFYPKNLEDFSHLTTPIVEGTTMVVDDPPNSEQPTWQWAFALQLKDADNDQSTIWVNVHHHEAQFLLGNNVDDPGDLRHDSQLLARLRETLAILWGDIEENQSRGKSGISNRPFECCIQEYGVPIATGEVESDELAVAFGYKRQYSLFGVTIL